MAELWENTMPPEKLKSWIRRLAQIAIAVSSFAVRITIMVTKRKAAFIAP